MRTVTLTIQVKAVIKVDEGVEVGEIINELNYNFADTTTKADIEDTEIVGYTVHDSR